MEEVRQARQNKIELQELKKKSLGGGGRSSAGQNEEIARLQRVIADMQKNQKTGVQFSNVSSTSNSNMYELEFKLHQA